MSPWLFLVLSYLWGAIPASYVAGRLVRGIDLRQHGSGNLGATNTFRVLGPKVAAPVMAFDILKGFLPVFLFARWDAAAAGPWDLRWKLAYGAAAIIGHVFSVYVGFKGGKGVATSAGVFLALAPLPVGVGLLVWLVVLRATRMVSAASISAAAALGVLLLFVPGIEKEVRILGWAVVLFVIFAHRSNIGRILKGTEPRFGSRQRDTVAAAAATADAEETA
ncbi:MAG TPA: glycerol-3-phosphate 1-O-acyltransferase PlsY [Longimicrobium sp.]|nr:glycerol-3-phosphate 1-O-acyltransferase PlsY [Longimicrobium sp.]